MENILIIIKSILLLIAAAFILLAAYGIIRFKDDIPNVLYARIHILGIADVACIIALLVLNEPLLAVAYFILVPFASHAIANGHYYGEEEK